MTHRPQPVHKSNRELWINLVGWDNGGGLSTDLHVLTQVLQGLGCRTLFNGRPRRHLQGMHHRIVHRLRVLLRHTCTAVTGAAYDINFFLETIDPDFLPHARVNCLIPNPEWFREENVRYLPKIDWVLCKTPSAVETFKALSRRTRYLGFTSPDRLDTECKRDSDNIVCLHAAGSSDWKGTSAVVGVWSRHPEWPRLIVIRNSVRYGGLPIKKLPDGPNIEYVTGHLDDTAWKWYQNACAIHVCPSEAEGFGHLIVEAMSCGAAIVTTDAPPMNELVTAECGVLVRTSRAEPMRLGVRHFVDEGDLEQQISRVIGMRPEERRALGRNARRLYETRSTAFEDEVKALLDESRAMLRESSSAE